MLLSILLDSTTTSSGLGSLGMIVWLVVLFAVMYFLMIRPQKKQQKEKDRLLNEAAIGDTVLTTSGFYGTIIDMQDDTVIVEFGNDKHCRIPMAKSAIADIEKPEDAVATEADTAVETEEKPKKKLFGKKED